MQTLPPCKPATCVAGKPAGLARCAGATDQAPTGSVTCHVRGLLGSEEGRPERLAVDQSAGVANLAQGLAEKIRKEKPVGATASDDVRSPEYASSTAGEYGAGVNLDWDQPASGSTSSTDYSTDWSSSSSSAPTDSPPPSAPGSPPSDSDYQIPDY